MLLSCHQLVDGGGALQNWRIALNIPNKESRTTDVCLAGALGIGLTILDCKKCYATQNL